MRRAFELYKTYMRCPCDKTLIQAVNALVPVIRRVVYNIGMRGFDAAAAESDVAGKIRDYINRNRYDTRNLSAERFGMWAYRGVRKYAYAVLYQLRYEEQFKHDPELRDQVKAYHLSNYRTRSDVEQMIFFEEEFPKIVRKKVEKSIRFGGKTKDFCMRIVDGLLAGIPLSEMNPKAAHGDQQHRPFLKRYSALILRETIAGVLMDNYEDLKSEHLKRIWDATEYQSYEHFPV